MSGPGGANPGLAPDAESASKTRHGITVEWTRRKGPTGQRDLSLHELTIKKTRNRALHLSRNEAIFVLSMLEEFLSDNDPQPPSWTGKGSY